MQCNAIRSVSCLHPISSNCSIQWMDQPNQRDLNTRLSCLTRRSLTSRSAAGGHLRNLCYRRAGEGFCTVCGVRRCMSIVIRKGRARPGYGWRTLCHGIGSRSGVKHGLFAERAGLATLVDYLGARFSGQLLTCGHRAGSQWMANSMRKQGVGSQPLKPRSE